MAFTVKIKNTITNPIRVAIADFGSDFRIDVPAAGQVDAGLFDAGHYAVAAWDAFSPDHPTIASTPVHMQGETLLTVKPHGITAVTPVEGG